MKAALSYLDKLIIKTLALILVKNQTFSKALQTILHSYKTSEQAELVNTVRRIIRYRRLYEKAVTIQGSQPITPARLLDVCRIEQQPALAQCPADLCLLQQLELVKKERAVRESIPDWLDELGQKSWGAAWDRLLAWQNTEPAIILRTNTLKTNREALLNYFKSRQIKATPHNLVPQAIRLEQYRNIFTLPAFRQGLFEMQDAGSQAVSELLNPLPGMRVIDACAGHGGKTLHLAALMQNKGRIIALDTDEYKFRELSRRARRAGVSIIETRIVKSTKVIKRLQAQADRLLLDVPCSGSGVWRRNPEGKERLTPEELNRLIRIQSEILASYSRLIKPGGRLVYAVCSLFPCEGETQIARFLAASASTQPDTGQPGAIFKLLMEQRLTPDQNDSDGFYLALLERLS